jgi:hypothetical protein
MIQAVDSERGMTEPHRKLAGAVLTAFFVISAVVLAIALIGAAAIISGGERG